MKKYLILLSVAITAIAYAAQDSGLSIRQVRDPVQLRAKLNANAADAESRLIAAAVTNGIATMEGGATLDNTSSAAELNITETTVKVTGILSVTGASTLTGVATFTAAPKFVTTNLVGAITLVMTNAPTACDAGKESPSYIRVTIGGVNYVVPAWPITP